MTTAKVKNFLRYPLYYNLWHPPGSPPGTVVPLLSSRTIYNPFGSCHWMISATGINDSNETMDAIIIQDGNGGLFINGYDNAIMFLSRYGSAYSGPSTNIQFFQNTATLEVVTDLTVGLDVAGKIVNYQSMYITVDIFTVSVFLSNVLTQPLAGPYMIITGGMT